ncbi:HNH endonuclease signature motif containing protein, partial [Cryobacterium shii]|uniref:HNH endonuclease signature motif containing protein n=1 Tax=Cryobacterium shii TaxID=1259235 RepID=UPI00135C7403
MTAAVEQLGRRVDALRVATAAAIADRSRPELDTGRLSVRKACITPSDLIQRVTLVSRPTAQRRIRLGAQLRTRFTLARQALPPAFPATAAGLASGEIGLDSVDAILTALVPTLRCTDLDQVQAAESELVAAATGGGGDHPVAVPADEIRIQALVWKTVIAPDGSGPDDRAMQSRGLRLGRERDGIIPLSGSLMPEIGGKLQRLFDAYLSPKSAPVAFLTEKQRQEQQERALLERDPRTPDQQRHDVLAVILDVAARVADAPTLGGAAPTVLVSVREQDLNADFGQGAGVGWIDSVEAPIKMTTIKDLVCSGGSENVVFSSDGRVLKLGVPDRCFTANQRKAIQLRDGGCIIPGCRIPASMTEIHHVVPDAAGGPTHTDNGVCLSLIKQGWFDHRMLDSTGWQIRMVRGSPEVMAPPWLESG